MRKTVLAAIGMAVGLYLAPVYAQNLQMAGVPTERSATTVPPRGSTMAQVEQRFGTPADRLAAIGQPPITRWVYPAFVVYFEHNLVIHAVATTPATPKN
jgi:hypothetical protein